MIRKPPWLRMHLPTGDGFDRVNGLLQSLQLNTVCTSARCPNLAECWARGTATIMILGDSCTRRCRFCSVGQVRSARRPGPHDPEEALRVAEAVRRLGLRYVVITSVDRDDLPDLGAQAFAATVSHIRKVRPETQIEVLTPDFGARAELVRLVIESGPDVFGHNIETVERLTPRVRDPRAGYRLSLRVLELVKVLAPSLITKSGLMLGLGESDDEIGKTLSDLRAVGCDIITLGQYLQPDRRCLPVARYVPPAEFGRWESEALALGFRAARCGPLVRSSYQASELTKGLTVPAVG
ncbi:MAG: lipoyl synthase [candidate division WOR-3 bacterium]